MIMWYYRNIVYWLIPADRYQPIWWQSLVDIAKLPKLAEELHVANAKQAFDTLRFEHYLYFGQLAEAYLSQARGACSTFIIHPYLYKPKIPWWEWIQEFVDIWIRSRRSASTRRSEVSALSARSAPARGRSWPPGSRSVPRW
jgi:hypothetical protein